MAESRRFSRCLAQTSAHRAKPGITVGRDKLSEHPCLRGALYRWPRGLPPGDNLVNLLIYE